MSFVAAFALTVLLVPQPKAKPEVQTKDRKYISFLRPGDKPAIHLNKEILNLHRERMRPYYYDATKYKTYLEQLGIKYPTYRVTTPAPATKDLDSPGNQDR